MKMVHIKETLERIVVIPVVTGIFFLGGLGSGVSQAGGINHPMAYAYRTMKAVVNAQDENFAKDIIAKYADFIGDKDGNPTSQELQKALKNMHRVLPKVASSKYKVEGYSSDAVQKLLNSKSPGIKTYNQLYQEYDLK